MDAIQLFELAVAATICAAVTAFPVFLVVLIATAIGRQWLAPWARQALWSLVLLRSLIPESVSSPLSLQPAASRAYFNVSAFVDAAFQARDVKKAIDIASDQSFGSEPQASGSSISPHLAVSVDSAHEPFDWIEFLLVRVFGTFIMSGALFTFVWTVMTTIRLHHRIRLGTICQKKDWLALLEEGQGLFGIEGTVTLRTIPKLLSPATYGWWRPTILLPEDASVLTATELRHVFWHELAHIRRNDVAQNWVLALVRVCHWWNPIFWWAQSEWLAERELACDALALRRLEGSQSGDYGKTLLRFLERLGTGAAHMPSSAAPGLVLFLGRKRKFRRRLEQLSILAKPESAWRSWLAKAFIVLLGVAGLTDAAARPMQVPSTRSMELPEGTKWTFNSRESSDGDEPRSTVVYDAAPIIARMLKDSHIGGGTDEDNVRFLQQLLNGALGRVHEITAASFTGEKPLRSTEEQFRSNCVNHGNQLIVAATAMQHVAVQRLLDRWQEIGFPQICIEISFVTTENSLKDLLPSAGGKVLNTDAAINSRESLGKRSISTIQTWTQNNVPAFVQTLTPQEDRILRVRLNGEPRSAILFNPKVTLFDGQSANLSEGRSRPFVTGLRTRDDGKFETQVSEVHEGVKVSVRAELARDHKTIELHVTREESELVDVEVLQVHTVGEPRSVQVPHVSQSIVNMITTVPDGHSLVVVPLRRDGKGQLTMTVIRPLLIQF